MILTGSPVRREMTKTAMEMPMMMIIECRNLLVR
jgi:hypothetical protein